MNTWSVIGLALMAPAVIITIIAIIRELIVITNKYFPLWVRVLSILAFLGYMALLIGGNS